MKRFLSWAYRIQFCLPSFLLPCLLLFACNLATVLICLGRSENPSPLPSGLDIASMAASLLTAILALFSHFNSNRILRKALRDRDESRVISKNVISYKCVNRSAVDMILSLSSPVLSIINTEYQWLICLMLVIVYWFLSSIPLTYFLDPLLLCKWSFYEAEIENRGIEILVMPKNRPAKPGLVDVMGVRSDYYVCL